MAAGKVWIDPTLDDWPDNDFRVFCGNLDRSTTEAQLFDHFNKYASIAKTKIVKDPMGTSKGFGFVSFLQPLDCAKSIREMDQTWLGSRPIRVKRSDWKDRNMNQVMKKNKKEKKQNKRRGV
jgi:RNA recognition motif-containing protein